MSHQQIPDMSVSVIVITLNRPACVRRCLACIAAQNPAPEQILVVDASCDEKTRNASAEFPNVQYLRNDNGMGRMTASRNIGLKHAMSDVIAFLDDDAFAHPGWLNALLAAYTAPSIGAVGGRALNAQPDEATTGVEEIGRLRPNGTLTGYFAADPKRVIEVDHLMGCNMSFRREVLAQLGGFREDYPGISGVREDSDMCLRVSRLGYRILFNPAAVVDHIGAPQAKGRRFDWRYVYYSHRNHTAMLIRNFGIGSAIVWRSLLSGASQLMLEFGKRCAAATIRLAAGTLGSILGIGSGLRLRMMAGDGPERRDSDGETIRAALSKHEHASDKAVA